MSLPDYLLRSCPSLLSCLLHLHPEVSQSRQNAVKDLHGPLAETPG